MIDEDFIGFDVDIDIPSPFNDFDVGDINSIMRGSAAASDSSSPLASLARALKRGNVQQVQTLLATASFDVDAPLPLSIAH